MNMKSQGHVTMSLRWHRRDVMNAWAEHIAIAVLEVIAFEIPSRSGHRPIASPREYGHQPRYPGLEAGIMAESQRPTVPERIYSRRWL
jgi:hypothetical protein